MEFHNKGHGEFTNNIFKGKIFGNGPSVSHTPKRVLYLINKFVKLEALTWLLAVIINLIIRVAYTGRDVLYFIES